MGAILCALAAAIILVFNLVFTIAATAKNGSQNGLATIQEGSCSETEHLQLGIHFLINVLERFSWQPATTACSVSHRQLERISMRLMHGIGGSMLAFRMSAI